MLFLLSESHHVACNIIALSGSRPNGVWLFEAYCYTLQGCASLGACTVFRTVGRCRSASLHEEEEKLLKFPRFRQKFPRFLSHTLFFRNFFCLVVFFLTISSIPPRPPPTQCATPTQLSVVFLTVSTMSLVPARDHLGEFLLLLESTNGRDKLCRLMQYSSKFLKWRAEVEKNEEQTKVKGTMHTHNTPCFMRLRV